MKKFFLIIFIFFINFGILNADTGNSIASWLENTGATGCGTSLSHGVTHFGVPLVNTLNSGKIGSSNCKTHTYSGKYYTVPVVGNLTGCNPGDRAINVSQYGTREEKRQQVKQEIRQECKEIQTRICEGKKVFGKCIRSAWGLLNPNLVFFDKSGFTIKTETICNNVIVNVPVEVIIHIPNANLGFKQTTITCERHDDTPPKIEDITFSFNNSLDINNNNPGFIRANDHSITFSIKKELETNGADIAKITAKVENEDNEIVWDNRDRNSSDLSTNNFDKYTENFNFKKVDNFRNNNNYREYTYKIEDICDTAGNCLSHTGQAPKVFNFNVYANYIDSGKSIIEEPIQPGVADGQEKNFSFTLSDIYGNNIIPVKNYSGGIVRNLTFNTIYNNNLYLNQYNKNGSGIYSNKFYNGTSGNFIPLSIGNGKIINSSFNDTLIKDGVYNLGFKPYSPTFLAGANDGRQYVDGTFDLSGNTTVKLLDKSTPDTLFGSKNLQFKPLYYTSINGSIKDDNIIVGARQDSRLKISKNNPSVDSGNREILLEYGQFEGGSHKEHPNFELGFNENGGSNFEKIKSKQAYSNNLTKFIGKIIGENDIYTNLTQKGELSDKENKTYFATFVKNTFTGGIVSVYPSFVYGMTKYNGELNNEKNTFQRPLKIIGNTHSLYYTNVVQDDINKNIKLLGNLDKAELQKTIRKKVSDDTRSLVFNKATSTKSLTSIPTVSTSDYKVIGNTIYFSNLDGNNVEINISSKYTGLKNIVVQGGNAYIKRNIEANNKSQDILSIISIEQNGKGGFIYIDPNVTRLDSVLYGDKSIASYNGQILSPKNGGTYALLKNQLHIYGSVFSNNTIGGSINVDGSSVQKPVCPYYILSSNCTVDEAQKYDLYNFRRGYENILTNPKDTSSPLKTGYSGDIKYPLIIEYNPLIQSSKNPFFTVKK